MTAITPVGFVGLGTMGGTVARKMAATINLQVFDLQRSRMKELAKAGASMADNAANLAHDCDVILTSLPHSSDVENLLFGAQAMADSLRPGSVIVDLTTGDPTISRHIAQRLAKIGVDFADAPLAGGSHGVREGKLAVFVGARKEVFERVYPILSAASQRVFHTGDIGTGDVMKLVNNVIASSIRAITFEAIVLAAKNGINLQKCAEILPLSSARSYQTEVALPRLAEGRYGANFAVDLMIRDLRLATRLGRESNTPMTFGNMVCELYQSMANQLGGQTDVDQLINLFEQQANFTVVEPGKELASPF